MLPMATGITLAVDPGHQELHRNDVDLFADVFTDLCHDFVAAGTDALIFREINDDVAALNVWRDRSALAAGLG
ncbi:MAG: hypothetical protein EBY15_12230 [Gammaproteobacteria bacterium]|nr:hypothetical protein [Gammaproteobacteria bacterium]